MSQHDPISLFGLNSDLVKDDFMAKIVDDNPSSKIDPLEAYSGFIDKIKNEELSFDSSSYNESINDSNKDTLFNKLETSNTDDFYKSQFSYEPKITEPKEYKLDSPKFTPKQYFNDLSNNNSINENLYDKPKILGQNAGISNYSYGISNNTRQEKKSNPIDSIINNYGSFDTDKENEEEKTYENEIDDKKLILLEKIQNLRDLLAKEEVNLDNVPLVNYNSSMNEIQYTYRILMIKNNRDLNIDLTGNVIKGVSKVLEKIFDGKKSYFGMTLDLTGYTDTVDIQLRRLDVETEKVAGEFMNKTELNPYYKIALYLVPGMIAHSVLKRKRQNDTVYDNDKLINALNDISDN